MKVFVYDKRESKPFVTLNNVKSVEETKNRICFTMEDTSTFEVEKKFYKSTVYQN